MEDKRLRDSDDVDVIDIEQMPGSALVIASIIGLAVTAYCLLSPIYIAAEMVTVVTIVGMVFTAVLLLYAGTTRLFYKALDEYAENDVTTAILADSLEEDLVVSSSIDNTNALTWIALFSMFMPQLYVIWVFAFCMGGSYAFLHIKAMARYKQLLDIVLDNILEEQKKDDD